MISSPNSTSVERPSGAPVDSPLAGGSELLWAALDALPDLLGVWDKNLKLKSWNAGYAGFVRDLTGGAPHVGLTLAELCVEHPEFVSISEPMMHRALAGERLRESFVSDWAGAVRHWDLHVVPLTDPGTGEVIGVTQRVLDMTEEQSRRTAELARHRLMLDAVEGLVWDWDLISDTLDRVGSSTPFMGYASHEVPQGRGWWEERCHPDDIKRCDAAVLDAVASNDIERQEIRYRFRRADGTYGVVHDQIRIQRVAGRVVRVVGCMMDVTARVTAEAAAERSEERYRLATGLYEALVWDWDVINGTEVRSRPEGDFMGYVPAEVGDSTEWWQSNVHPEDRDRTMDRLYRSMREGIERLTVEYRFRRKDGTYAPTEDRVRLVYRDGRTVRVVACMRDMSAQVEARRSLEMAVARYQALVTTSSMGVWRADPTGQMIAPSQEMCRLLGIDAAEAKEMDIRRAFHPDDADRVIESWMKSLASGEDYSSEHRIKLADGSHRWHHVRATALRDTDGAIIEWVGAEQDIDERKAYEEALRHSESQFRMLAESIPAAIWISETEGGLQYVNPAYTAWSGYTADELNKAASQYGKDWGLAVIHPDDIPKKLAAWNEAARTGREYQVECRYRRRGGDYRWVICRAVPTMPLMPSGKMRYVGVLIDIEERRRYEAALRDRAASASEGLARLERVLDAAPVPMAIVARESGEFVYANSALRSALSWLSGLPGTELEAAVDTISLFDSRGQPVAQGMCPRARAGRGEAFSDMEFTCVGPGGRATSLVSSVELPELLDGKGGSVLVYQDITRLKRVERELRDASEAKDRFLAVLSHELRTPLTPVLSTAQMLESDTSLPPETREALSVIRRNVELETRLIDDLLDLTRLSRGKVRLDLRDADLREVLRNVADICRPELNAKGLDLRLDLGELPLIVSADSARLHQVFWNLLRNSIKFTAPGGHIDVRARFEPDPTSPAHATPTHAPAPVHVPGRGHVRVVVHDNGIGIPAHLLPRVFDAFVQGDHDVRRHGGLGLGLAIARALVELHGGQLSAVSQGPGLGAQFVARLPVSPATTPPGQIALSSSVPATPAMTTSQVGPANSDALTLNASSVGPSDNGASREVGASGIASVEGASVVSASGVGASDVIVPVVSAADSSGPGVSAGRVPPVSSGRDTPSLRILLVEDHADTARVMARLLTRLGHRPTVARDVATGLAALSAESFDLILSDIGLPDGSGYDLMRQAPNPRPPAVALSGFGMDDDIERSREAGFIDHLTKPVDANLLEHTLLRAVGAKV